MARKGENIYKRKDGRWEGRLLQSGGKFRYFYAKTYREVRAKMRDSREAADTKEEECTNRQLYASGLFQLWLEEVGYRLKPSTCESYYYCLQGYVIPHFRSPENRHLSKKSVLSFVHAIHKNDTISTAYQRKILSIFKTALRDISKTFPEYSSLVEIVVYPKVISGEEVSIFSIKEQKIIQNTVQKSSDRRLFGVILCFYTGIRLGELCALKWEDIDLDSGMMSISRTVTRIRNPELSGCKTMLCEGTPKSRTSTRKIPLPEFLLKKMKERSMGSIDEACYVLSEKTVPFDPRAYQRLYKSLLKDAGVKERKFHAIRHTFATRALELGVDIKTLSELLGHSNVSITLNIYAHSLIEQKKKAIEKFNQMYAAQMEIPLYAVNSAV
ncbi:MAG: site-specific integrase [Lachnospiraceae bacterium]